MAYLKELASKCAHCQKSAVVQVMTRRNEAGGRYCRQHGKRALARQCEIEAQNDADIARNPELRGVLS